MSNVNFVEQFNAIMEYVRENYIHSREAMLWIALFIALIKERSTTIRPNHTNGRTIFSLFPIVS